MRPSRTFMTWAEWVVDDDRRVHATLPGGGEIVRYDRAGKWYHEFTGGRKPLTVGDAVTIAGTTPGAQVHLGRPGGGRFDFLYRRDWGA